jgi:hypothetical protein
MWHVSAIPLKAEYGPQLKNATALNENTLGRTNKMDFWKEIWG